MASSVDELSIEWTDADGTVTVKELDKRILSKGAWSTILYLYQDLNRKTGEYGKHKMRIQRYQKRSGKYVPRSKFNISSFRQAGKIVDALTEWMDEHETAKK